MQSEEVKIESLDQEANHVIEEARMVLPGIQALFGFQLIAVFNSRFETAFAPIDQYLHLAALVLVALSIVLIMTPAAYHRQAERGFVSRYFTELASRLLTAALAPLLLAIVLEVFLVCKIILKTTPVSSLIGASLFAVFVWSWFVFPRLTTKHRSNKAMRRP